MEPKKAALTPRLPFAKARRRVPFAGRAAWIRKGGFAILDQGLFAGTNFLINIFMARWLEPAQYGAFATTYSIFVLIGAFHTGLLTEPMLVFGPGKYARQFGRYLGKLLLGHAGLTVVTSLLLGGAALLLWSTGESIMGPALLGLAVSLPFSLLIWLLRRACYVHSEPRWAAAGGGLYLAIMAAGALASYRLHLLSAFAALVVMGIAGSAVGLWLTRRLRPRWGSEDAALSMRMILADHWHYGKWSTPTSLLTWIPSNVYYTLLPIGFGLAASGAYGAVMNLAMPILHVNAALQVLLLPMYVRCLDAGGIAQLQPRVRQGLAAFWSLAAVYLIVIILFGAPIMDWLYEGRYNASVSLIDLVLVGLLPFAAGTVTIIGGALRAMQRIREVFWTYAVATLTTLTAGVAFLAAGGMTGAIVGFLVTYAVTAATLTWIYYRACRQPSPLARLDKTQPTV